MALVDDWLALLDRHFPFQTSDGLTDLVIVRDQVEIEGERLVLVLRLVSFEADGDRRMLMNLKEQRVDAGSTSALDDLDRYDAFLKAHAEVFSMGASDVLDRELPESVFFADVLDLQAQSFDDFGKALSAKSRFGEFVA